MNPQATNHPISWFKKFHDDDKLDLTPSFQRKPVWTYAQASYLIDSILNELPVPEVFVRTVTDQDGEFKLEVVDGQQRLRSIIRFYSGDLVLAGDDVTAEWNGYSWKKMSKKEKGKFWTFKVVVRELEGASDSEVRDMFRRLNANQSNLNDQELRHSQYSGEFIRLVESLADDPWWLANRIVTPAQIRRMGDAEYMSELLVGVMSGPLNKKLELDEYYSDYDEDFEDKDHWKQLFLKTREFTEKVTGGDLRIWKTKTEFYSLFLACGHFVLDEQPVPDGAQERLEAFKVLADEAKRKDARGRYPSFVMDYVEAVTRASTDLGRRLKRIGIVYDVITGSKGV